MQIPSGIAPYSHPVMMFNSLGELLVISFNGSVYGYCKILKINEDSLRTT